MIRSNELIVEFTIFSKKISYNEITNILGVNYDDFCEKGGKLNNSKIGPVNKLYIWSKKSKTNKFKDDLDIHLRSIFKILEPLKDKLIILKDKGCNYTFSIIRYNYNTINPCGYIKSDYIKFLGEIGSDIDFDIYCLREESE